MCKNIHVGERRGSSINVEKLDMKRNEIIPLFLTSYKNLIKMN
jgi:hypothetical protein